MRISCHRRYLMMLISPLASAVYAQNYGLNGLGFTGLAVTPTASILPWGSVSFAYDNVIANGPKFGIDPEIRDGRTYQSRGQEGHSFVGGVGLFPFLEVSGRLASNDLKTNCYTVGCGTRDLSVNAKLGFPLNGDGSFLGAIGVTDFGGQVPYFKSTYGVLTKKSEFLDLSLGYARSGDNLFGGKGVLDGAFGNVALRPFEWAQASFEVSKSNTVAGLRFIMPNAMLPNGWAAYIGANFSLKSATDLPRSWVSAGLTIPLYKVPVAVKNNSEKRPYESPQPAGGQTTYIADTPHQYSAATARQEFSYSGLPETTTLNSSADIDAAPVSEYETISPEILAFEFAELLKAKGFENISIGFLGGEKQIVLKVDNATYNVNSLDAVGVALGVIARRLGRSDYGYLLMVTQRQVPLVLVSGKAQCLKDWIDLKPTLCDAGKFQTPGIADLQLMLSGVKWKIESAQPPWSAVRISLAPVLRNAIASEYGVFDYSAGLRATIQQPLWSGAYVEFARIQGVKNSDDYDSDKVFGASRITNKTERVLFHQILNVPLQKIFDSPEATRIWGANALNAHFAAGKVSENYRGIFGELRWEPGDGTSRFGLEAGRFERITAYDESSPLKSRSLLATYRYSLFGNKTYLEATAGQFLYNDVGVKVGVKQWFDDVAVTVYARRTKFSWESVNRSFIGIEISVPLTPRKDMNASSFLQITGSPRWSYGVETRVGNLNYISRDQGLSTGIAVLDKTFNFDRAGASYFQENSARIRSAASR